MESKEGGCEVYIMRSRLGEEYVALCDQSRAIIALELLQHFTRDCDALGLRLHRIVERMVGVQGALARLKLHIVRVHG